MRDCEIINENLRCALAGFSWVDSGGDTARTAGLSLSYSGIPYGLFNTAVLTDPAQSADFPQHLADASSFFARRHSPWSIWFCEDFFTPEQRRRSRISLATMDLKTVMEAPGMITRQIAVPSTRLPSLEYRRVGDTRTALDFSRIMSAAFAVPIDMSDRVYASPRLWRGPVRGFVSYLDGEPVSTTAVAIGGDAIGLYAVATHPKQQRRGYGESLMRSVLEDVISETAIETVVLQSSAAGYPLYLRMGFRHVTRFSVFLSDPNAP